MSNVMSRISESLADEREARVGLAQVREAHVPGRLDGGHGDDAVDKEILTRHQFLRRIQTEKRRTDRSKAPLSLVLFRLSGEQSGRPAGQGTVADVLRRSTRETDVVGYLDEGVVGLLLTHTGNLGLHGFVRSFATRASHLTFTTSAGTYPDQIFETLLNDYSGQPDTLPYFLGHPGAHGPFAQLLKRCLDIGGAITLLVLASPLMLVAAIAVKATSPGPVIFSQTRLGRRGVPFRFFKFRSMTTGADDGVHRHYVANLIDGRCDEINQGDAEKPIYKLQRDARVTRVGSFLRKTSMDELPQLFNVLRGEMSLVGPRPPIPYEVERYQSWHLRRVLECRPGLTGLWQVEGRNRVSFDEMVRLDLRYARSWSIWLDIKILFRTVLVVIRSNGDS